MTRSGSSSHGTIVYSPGRKQWINDRTKLPTRRKRPIRSQKEVENGRMRAKAHARLINVKTNRNKFNGNGTRRKSVRRRKSASRRR